MPAAEAAAGCQSHVKSLARNLLPANHAKITQQAFSYACEIGRFSAAVICVVVH